MIQNLLTCLNWSATVWGRCFKCLNDKPNSTTGAGWKVTIENAVTDGTSVKCQTTRTFRKLKVKHSKHVQL